MYYHNTGKSVQDSARAYADILAYYSFKNISFMRFIGGARRCCVYFYTRSVIRFRGRKGLYNAAVGLQLTHYVTSHL